jgi:hypothetical protein
MGKHPEIDSLTPKTDFSRREFFVAGAAATGFAMAVRPVAASTIVTPPHGLTMGEPKIQASDRMIPGYYAHPETGSNFPVTLVARKSSASTSTSRTYAGGSPSSATSRSRPNCSCARATP